MRFLILGAGQQGSACAYDLLSQGDVAHVTLADVQPERAAPFLPSDSRLVGLKLDFQDADAVRAAMEEADIVLSAAPYYFNQSLARLAIETGCHYSDLGGNTEILRAQIAMSEEAEKAGCSLVPDVGLAPGMVNILAAEGIRRLDHPSVVRMYVGGLPQHPVPPLNYQVVYSLEGMLDYNTTLSWILRDGQPTRVEALSELEEIEFGELGRLEAFHTAGGASLMPWDYRGEVERLEYKTLRYPGHAVIMKAIRDLGLLSLEPVRVGDTEVVPRDVFLACAQPLLQRPGEPDLVALRVVAEGTSAGAQTRLTWDLLDREDETSGITAMERTTGFTLAIVGLLLGRGVIERPGVAPSYRAIPYEPYIRELESRGIEFRVSERTGEAMSAETGVERPEPAR
ncbi:MAG: saccharopine dehydrogenase family protein [Gemmatimonadota bacterium]